MSDVVVIGAGVDALVAAHRLSRAGHRVTVIEECPSDIVVTGWVPPQVARDLNGLVAERNDPWLTLPLPEGGTLELWHDLARSVEAIRRISPRDAGKWPEFSDRMARLAHFFERLYAAPPPGLVDLRFALKLRGLGRQSMEDLMRLLPMPVAELLDEWFESDLLKGALGALGIMHLQQGPRSAGTAFRLLHHHVGSPTGVFRPARSNLGELLRRGIELRRGRARRITLRAGRVTAVALEGGEEIAASLVVSAAAPRRSLLELVEPGWLDPELVRALGNVRERGVVAKVTLELERAPDFRTLAVAPSLDYLERAYDPAKYGRVSDQPYLEVTASAAGAEAHFQFAPYRLAAGDWDDAHRHSIGNLTSKLLAKRLPPIKSTTVMAPPDLEAREGWPEGQAYQAELSLDQALWMRPVPELARYGTPIGGLWLCGPGMHPGGAILGAAGYNCAKEILSARVN